MYRLPVLIVFVSLLTTSYAQDTDRQERNFSYAPGFRYCPDRDYDLAWENDLVAFRVYGKDPYENAKFSGVDCWHKKVNYPILDRWYGHLFTGKTYHTDYGEGCDQYHVGKTRGVGGVGLWKNDKIVSSGLYEDWEVISQTQTKLSFKLVYSWKDGEERIVETRIVTIVNNSQLYSAESHFTKNGIPMVGIDVAVGLSTQNGEATVTLSEKSGWMSAWHALGNNTGMIGTGVVVETKQLVNMLDQKMKDVDSSHAIAVVKTDVNGAIRWKAGFAWNKAGNITKPAEWDVYLNNSVFQNH